MILSCQNICKAFGEKVILNDASFHIEEREKAALIGSTVQERPHCCGSSCRSFHADSGTVVLAQDKRSVISPSIRISTDILPFTKNFLPPNSTSSIWKNAYPQYGTGMKKVTGEELTV